MALRDIPRVAIMSGINPLAPEISAIYPDHLMFMEKAVGHLALGDRRRIAHLSISNAVLLSEGFIGAVARHGMVTRPYWQLMVNSLEPSPARNIAHCLMRLPVEDRPDGLVISDDNLVEETVAGLIDAGIRVPDELTVVAHANFPRCPASPLSVFWLGFDLREVLDRCMAIIRQERQGGTPPAVSYIRAVDYAEYTAARHLSAGKRTALPAAPSFILKGATT